MDDYGGDVEPGSNLLGKGDSSIDDSDEENLLCDVCDEGEVIRTTTCFSSVFSGHFFGGVPFFLRLYGAAQQRVGTSHLRKIFRNEELSYDTRVDVVNGKFAKGA